MERVALDLGLDRVVALLVQVGVYRCPVCTHHFRGQPPFLRRDAVYSRRVVDAAVQSVLADGMAVTRVVERMARDFWLRPSEATVRSWCRAHAHGVTLDAAYTRWVVGSFSGVLCVDEVYQNQLALLLAVDPAAPDGDRLVGYQLVHGDVACADVEAFLTRLREEGICPAQVVTDGSSLYPAVVAKVWPRAVHQLCLFHETRNVVKATLKAIDALRTTVPVPPAMPQVAGRRRLRNDPAGPHPDDRASRVAWVRQLHADGLTITEIAGQTGHTRLTVRRWLREPTGPTPTALADAERRAQRVASVRQLHRSGVTIREIVRRTGHSRTTVREWLRGPSYQRPDRAPRRTPPTPREAPPPPWRDWDQVRQVRRDLAASRYQITARIEGLTPEVRVTLAALFDSPVGASLRAVHAFTQGWYRIWRDERGARRAVEEARSRYQTLRAEPSVAAHPPLRRIQARMTDVRFEQLSHFLRTPTWEATSNGAERGGRQFRHLQAPHFGFRTTRSIEAALNMEALRRMRERTQPANRSVGRSARGRPRCGGADSISARV